MLMPPQQTEHPAIIYLIYNSPCPKFHRTVRDMAPCSVKPRVVPRVILRSSRRSGTASATAADSVAADVTVGITAGDRE